VKIRPQELAATEQRNPRSRGLDAKSTIAILGTINHEDAQVARAVARELPAIARAVDQIVRAFRRGGHLFYIGAGTSGRLATLDASECPPTFGISPETVQAIMAGGAKAFVKSFEDAEDSTGNGARDLARCRINSRDIVVGVTASGRTPYVLGALKAARKRGAFTIAITSNRHSPAAEAARISIAPQTGAEAIAGSTRMKAGTAQKMVLNMLSTAAMVRLGYVYDNWMINVAQSNVKLRGRALQILQEAGGVSSDKAAKIMRQAGNDLRIALVIAKTGLTASEARQRLTATRGNVRAAIASGNAQKHVVSARSRRRGPNTRERDFSPAR
jgi:N-acetylmuramic acid 6-phosphate etherase